MVRRKCHYSLIPFTKKGKKRKKAQGFFYWFVHRCTSLSEIYAFIVDFCRHCPHTLRKLSSSYAVEISFLRGKFFNLKIPTPFIPNVESQRALQEGTKWGVEDSCYLSPYFFLPARNKNILHYNLFILAFAYIYLITFF